VRKFKVAEVSEKELEDLVRQAPESIEEGLRFVDHQAFTPRGPLDVLLVDSGNALVVAELKVVGDDAMLMQGVDYYDYLLRNLHGFAHAYKQHNIDPTQEPRLLLVAPSFSVTLLNRVKWISVPVSLFTFQCVEFEDTKGEKVIVCKETAAPAAPPLVVVYQIDAKFNYITDDEMRDLARLFVETVRAWDPQRTLVEATKYDISIKLSGRALVYLGPRRKHFVIYACDEEGKWVPYPANNEADLRAVIPLVRASFDRIAGSQRT